MKFERIWNVSDHPNTKVQQQTLVILGHTVLPGHSVVIPSDLVDAADLKLEREQELGLVYIGDQPAIDYQLAKGMIRVPSPPDSARTHGPGAPAPAKTKAKTKKDK